MNEKARDRRHGDIKLSRGMGPDSAVTRTEFGPAQFGSSSSCSGRGGGSPRPERFVSEDAKRAAGGEMALDVECVVDGGVNGQETLGGSGRFETLHLALAPSSRLMRILGPVVCAGSGANVEVEPSRGLEVTADHVARAAFQISGPVLS